MEVDRLRYSKVKGVVLDTNMLLVPFQFRVDILEEIWRLLPGIKIYTIPQVLKELEKLEKNGTISEKLGARIGRVLSQKVELLPTKEGPADRILFELSKKGYVIATNDQELRRKIREAGGLTIYLRKRDHLEIG